MLAAGISVAMFPYEWSDRCDSGPTYFAIVADRTTKIMDDVDQFALKTVNLLGARRRGHSRGRRSG